MVVRSVDHNCNMITSKNTPELQLIFRNPLSKMPFLAANRTTLSQKEEEEKKRLKPRNSLSAASHRHSTALTAQQ